MDPVTGAALISTGGQLLGGLMGGKQKRPSYQPWIKALVGADKAKNMTLADAMAWQDKSMFNAKMESAKEHGIHPLAMLGVPFGGGMSPTSTVGDTGMDSSVGYDLGQGLGRAAEAYATKDERAIGAKLQSLALERSELENESIRSDIALKRGQLAPAFPNPNLKMAIAGQGDSRYPEQSRMPMGYGDTGPLLRKGKDPNGDTIRVYNDDLGDNEILQALTALGVSLPDMAANAGKRVGQWLREPRFKRGWWSGD